MRIIGDGAQIINRDHINVFATAFDNPPKHQTPNASKSVNCNIYSHD